MIVKSNEYIYFQYEVPKVFGSYFIYVKANPGADKLKLYASSHNLYPDENSHQWSSDTIKNYRSALEMFKKETFPELEIFILDYDNKLIHLPYLENEVIETKKEYTKGSIALKIDNENWKHRGAHCYISCKNISSTPIPITISVNCNTHS